MELILNELSFDGQFHSQDDFVEYTNDVLIPLLDVVIKNEIPLLKKSDLYDYPVTSDATLQDLLIQTGDPSITLLKGYIVSLGYCEPYWDLETLTDPEVSYEYPASADEPNCFTEAVERGDSLLSLQRASYDSDKFLCKRDGVPLEVINVTEVKKLLKGILIEDKKKIRYIIEQYPYQRSVKCVEVNERCYAEEALLENDLETGDLLAIVDAVAALIGDLGQGRKSDLWDKLQEDIFELRMRVSSNRIFRLLFVQYDGIQFLNGFIKKTQQTPDREIAKAIEIKKKIKR